jgi:hypothetical protein
LSARIVNQDISFEVTIIEDPNMVIPDFTRAIVSDLGRVLQTFHSKIIGKVRWAPATDCPFILVIDP